MSDSKPVLIIQQTEYMSRERTQSAYEMSKRIGQRLGFEAVFVPMGMSAHVDPGDAIVEALNTQTKAINRLVETNQRLIDCFLSCEPEDQDGGVTLYLEKCETG